MITFSLSLTSLGISIGRIFRSLECRFVGRIGAGEQKTEYGKSDGNERDELDDAPPDLNDPIVTLEQQIQATDDRDDGHLSDES